MKENEWMNEIKKHKKTYLTILHVTNVKRREKNILTSIFLKKNISIKNNLLKKIKYIFTKPFF